MPVVKTPTIIDGMVLAEDISINGKVVLPAGTSLRAGMAKKLVAAGVHQVMVTEESYGLTVMVVEPEPQPNPAGTHKTMVQTRKTGEETPSSGDTAVTKNNLLRVAHMFEPHRDDALMRELCRLAIKCAQERLIRV